MAKNVIDELVVVLGLDSAQFTKEQKSALEGFKKTKDEAARTAKDMEARGKQAAEFFSPITKAIVGLGTAFFGLDAIKNFTKDLIVSDAAVGRLAKNVGVNVEALSAWRGVIKRFGGSEEEVDNAFRAMARDAQELALTGGSKFIPFLARAGVDTAKFYDKATTAEEKLRMLSAAFAKLDPQTAQLYGQNMGLSESFVTMLSVGGPALDALISKQRSLNIATKESSDAAIGLNAAWSNLSDTLAGSARKLESAALPRLTQKITELNQVLNGSLGSELYDFLHPDDRRLKLLPQGKSGSREMRGKIGGASNDAKSQLMSLGWTDAQATGILNNLKRESGINPRAVGDGGNAYGVAQWHPDRQADFKKLFGKDIRESTLEEQLRFLDSELRIGKEKRAGRSLAGAQNAAEATRIVYEQYERPAMPYDQYMAMAQGGRAPAGSSSSSEVNIGQIVVNTKATDADGIAKDIGTSVKNLTFASQAQSGLE